MMRVLIIGYGDVAQRFARQLAASPAAQHVRWAALIRRKEIAPQVRSVGGQPLFGDLDDFRKLQRLAVSWDVVLYFAPPPSSGFDDPRLRRAIAALRGRTRRFVYLSTTGVYGDCAGDWIDETRPLHPESARAKRRVAAEQLLRRRYSQRRRNTCGANTADVLILRVPGIYAEDRLPVERIRNATPALTTEDDGYSNHIHADDLARVSWLAAFRGKPARAYNVVDDTQLKMGAWFDAVADAFELPRPPKIPAAQIQAHVSPALWSFMRESRRIRNARMKSELRIGACVDSLLMLRTLRSANR